MTLVWVPRYSVIQQLLGAVIGLAPLARYLGTCMFAALSGPSAPWQIFLLMERAPLPDVRVVAHGLLTHATVEEPTHKSAPS